jgi:hypothetical protein
MVAIDPPPIVQLIVRGPDTSPEAPDPELHYVVYYKLWSANVDYQEPAMSNIGTAFQ